MWATAVCVRADLFASSLCVTSHCSSQCCGVLWGGAASVKRGSGLKRCVCLSEVFHVSAFIIEPYNILYNSKFFFWSNLFCSHHLSLLQTLPPANPSSCKPSGTILCEPTTAGIQKSCLSFRAAERCNWSTEFIELLTLSAAHKRNNPWYSFLKQADKICPPHPDLFPVARAVCPRLCGQYCRWWWL